MSTVTKRASYSSNDQDSELRKGPWTLEEDSQLIHYISRHGEGRWNMLAKLAGLKRTGKSCRLRWLNYLKPDIKRGNLSPQEQILILELHSKWGNRWSKIAQHLPGRTDNEIKNYWRTRVQKQARQLNIESGSERFLDAVRCFWMPRLLQDMEQSSSAGFDDSSIAMNRENPPNFSMLTSPVAPSLPSSLPPPTASVDFQHNGNTSICFSNLNVSWTDPMNILHPPDVSEWPSSPCHATEIYNAFAYSNSINKSDVSSNNHDQAYAMVGLNFDPIPTAESNDISQYGCHIADCDWILDNMADALWNMDAM